MKEVGQNMQSSSQTECASSTEKVSEMDRILSVISHEPAYWIGVRVAILDYVGFPPRFQCPAQVQKKPETLHYNLQKGEIIPIDRTFEDEKDAIENEAGDLQFNSNTIVDENDDSDSDNGNDDITQNESE